MIGLQKKGISLAFIFFSFFIIFFPLTSYSAVVSTGGIVVECANGPAGECEFDDLISVVQSVVNWGTVFAISFSVVVIAFAGFKYIQSGDKPGERAKANTMMTKVAIGMFFILAAWLIVTFITSGLGLKGDVPTFLGN